MPFRKMIAVRSGDRMKWKIYSVGKMHSYWMLKQVVHIVTSVLQTVNTTTGGLVDLLPYLTH
jgi:hypothetical protein